MGQWTSSAPKKKTKHAALRATAEQNAYLEELVKRGRDKSATLSTALDLLIELEREVGPRLLEEIERLAEMHRTSVGALVGRAVKLGWPIVSEKLKP